MNRIRVAYVLSNEKYAVCALWSASASGCEYDLERVAEIRYNLAPSENKLVCGGESILLVVLQLHDDFHSPNLYGRTSRIAQMPHYLAPLPLLRSNVQWEEHSCSRLPLELLNAAD